MKNQKRSFPLQGQIPQRKSIFSPQNTFHGYCLSCSNFGHKSIDCRWHERKQGVLGSNNPRMRKVARRRHVGSNRGLNKNVGRYRNSFAPFLSLIEC